MQSTDDVTGVGREEDAMIWFQPGHTEPCGPCEVLYSSYRVQSETKGGKCYFENN